MVDDASPTAAALSEDGSTLAVGFDDLSVRWYAADGMLERGRVSLIGLPGSEDMGGFQRVPFMLRFADDGRLLASLEWYDHWIRPGERDTSLIDLARGRLVALPEGFRDASISADGGFAVLHDDSGGAQLWRTDPWQAAGPPFAVPQPPMPTLLTRGARYAAVFNPSMSSFRLLDPRVPQTALPLELPSDAGLSVRAESSDGRWLVIGDHAGRLHRIELASLILTRLLQVLRGEVTGASFSEDDRWLAVSNSSGAVMVFDIESGAALLPDSLVHDFPIRSLGIVRQQQLLMVSGEAQVALWRLPLPGALAHRPQRLATSPTPMPGALPQGVALAGSAGLLATAAVTGERRLWQVPASQLQAARGPALSPEQALPVGGRMVEVDWNQLRLVELDGSMASEWISLPEPPGFAELVDDDRRLLVVSGRAFYDIDANTLRIEREPLQLPASPQRMLVVPGTTSVVFTFGHGEPGVGFVERLLQVDRATNRLNDSGLVLPGPLALRASADGARLLIVGPRHDASRLYLLPGMERAWTLSARSGCPGGCRRLRSRPANGHAGRAQRGPGNRRRRAAAVAARARCAAAAARAAGTAADRCGGHRRRRLSDRARA